MIQFPMQNKHSRRSSQPKLSRERRRIDMIRSKSKLFINLGTKRECELCQTILRFLQCFYFVLQNIFILFFFLLQNEFPHEILTSCFFFLLFFFFISYGHYNCNNRRYIKKDGLTIDILG